VTCIPCIYEDEHVIYIRNISLSKLELIFSLDVSRSIIFDIRIWNTHCLISSSR